MSQHSRLTRTALLVAVAALVASLALPALAAAPTSHDRYTQWIDSLQTILDTRTDLSKTEASALWDGIRAVDPGMFEDDAPPAVRKALKKEADALQARLGCQSYGQALAGFGELKSWLESSEVIASATTSCTCGSSGCESGYHCSSVNCTSPPHTTHWGICKKDKAILVDQPVEPVAEF